MKEVSVGISPCPNDTFVFGGLVRGFVDTKEYCLRFELKDIETLNALSQKGTFDVIKISVANYKFVEDKYVILKSGAALGRGVGPIVVAKEPLSIEELKEIDVAIPGKFTTASFLFRRFIRPKGRLVEVLYHEVMDSILKDRVQAGILIHETRFVYEAFGLIKVLDLGELWEKETSLPLPLGVIVARRDLGREFCMWFEKKIRESIDFATLNREKIWGFVRENAREMDEKVIESHIETFVNSYTYDLTEEGKSAILKLIHEV